MPPLRNQPESDASYHPMWNVSWRDLVSPSRHVFAVIVVSKPGSGIDTSIHPSSPTGSYCSGSTTRKEHLIALTSSTRLRHRLYLLPYVMRQTLFNELEDMENLGIIRKSNSPYASPVVVVKKKDGSNGVCIDYRRMNKLTVYDPHPTLPHADIFQGMENDKYCSKIDLSKGYWQIPVRQEDVPETVFMAMDRHC
ncbi:Zinc finger protein [Plakobranchus ocellatus]|uniref:Zinc finger protein n=1 Tax=Plakobranchus ocellatus TaxID=259542 RepID=A0AAV3ZK74_9GAST|nr:Zinc finger protein [Plakobranchus ocellatus]